MGSREYKRGYIKKKEGFCNGLKTLFRMYLVGIRWSWGSLCGLIRRLGKVGEVISDYNGE